MLQAGCTQCDAGSVGPAGNAFSSCVGVPVLVSPNKSRSLTSVTRSTPGISISSCSSCQAVFAEGGERVDYVAFAERVQLSMYLENDAEAFAPIVQNYMIVDCSSVSGRELLTLGCGTEACALDQKQLAMWWPPQDIFVYVVCSQHQSACSL